LSDHADCIHPVPLLDDLCLKDSRADGVVVVVNVEEEVDVAGHLDQVEDDGNNRNTQDSKFFPED
jgi:hypothetical protein